MKAGLARGDRIVISLERSGVTAGARAVAEKSVAEKKEAAKAPTQ